MRERRLSLIREMGLCVVVLSFGFLVGFNVYYVTHRMNASIVPDKMLLLGGWKNVSDKSLFHNGASLYPGQAQGPLLAQHTVHFSHVEPARKPAVLALIKDISKEGSGE